MKIFFIAILAVGLGLPSVSMCQHDLFAGVLNENRAEPGEIRGFTAVMNPDEARMNCQRLKLEWSESGNHCFPRKGSSSLYVHLIEWRGIGSAIDSTGKIGQINIHCSVTNSCGASVQDIKNAISSKGKFTTFDINPDRIPRQYIFYDILGGEDRFYPSFLNGTVDKCASDGWQLLCFYRDYKRNIGISLLKLPEKPNSSVIAKEKERIKQAGLSALSAIFIDNDFSIGPLSLLKSPQENLQAMKSFDDVRYCKVDSTTKYLPNPTKFTFSVWCAKEWERPSTEAEVARVRWRPASESRISWAPWDHSTTKRITVHCSYLGLCGIDMSLIKQYLTKIGYQAFDQPTEQYLWEYVAENGDTYTEGMGAFGGGWCTTKAVQTLCTDGFDFSLWSYPSPFLSKKRKKDPSDLVF